MMLPGALLLFGLFVTCLFAFFCSLVVYVCRASPVCSCSAYGSVCDTRNDRVLGRWAGGAGAGKLCPPTTVIFSVRYSAGQLLEELAFDCSREERPAWSWSWQSRPFLGWYLCTNACANSPWSRQGRSVF